MKKCIITIPLPYTNLLEYEIMSLKQVLSFYQDKYDDIDIALCCPWNIDIYDLEKYNINLNGIITLPIDPYWSQSIATYNALCTNNQLYNLFSDYEYMLIYQLDAFIFKDELYYWCDKGYDYIGGVEAIENFKKDLNGGFSLRKISVFNELTKNNNYSDEIVYRFEDSIFTSEIYKDNNITIPVIDLLTFSINCYTHHYTLFSLLNPNLPFGCHKFYISPKVYELCKQHINYKE